MNIFNKLRLFIDGFIEGSNEEAAKQKKANSVAILTVQEPCFESEEDLYRDDESKDDYYADWDETFTGIPSAMHVFHIAHDYYHKDRF